MTNVNRRLLVASNRLPVTLEQHGEEWGLRSGTGGLVTALSPVMARCNGLWVGWVGTKPDQPINQLFEQFRNEQQYDLRLVPLTQEEENKFYRGFSNESLWPLLHSMLGYCKFNVDNFRVYENANQRFAEVIHANLLPDDFIWVHDYQLMLAARYLRQMDVHHAIAFFLHIPFPSYELFRCLPWRKEIIRGMMEYDLLGFQTLRDFRNFIQCARGVLPEITAGSRTRQSLQTLRWNDHLVRVGHFPISIDYDEFNDHAHSPEVDQAAWYLHENLSDRQLVLGIDRLDYTKGIIERFLAFERALEKYPEIQEKVSLLQVVVPSRTRIPDYANLKGMLDEMVGRINARFSHSGWVPIHYMFRNLDRTQLLGHYRAAEIALITPLRDGMNLIAKEYCACSIDNNGVLVLSEFAGSAEELGKWALLVNPYDVESCADAIYQAFTMDSVERARRMRGLRQQIRRNSVHRWMDRFMTSMDAIEPT
jgi:trehalose 6-phosphate synthase/phosphatase